jgi:sugar phosphate isomerase/epimerase
VCFCIEPNAAAYGCDFVRDTSEGIGLVAAVDDPGFRLHLDGGVMTMNGEAIEDALAAALPHLTHLHISEPNLAPVGAGGTDHRRIAAALRTLGYQGWTSIEMRAAAPPGESNLPGVRTALELALATYGG